MPYNILIPKQPKALSLPVGFGLPGLSIPKIVVFQFFSLLKSDFQKYLQNLRKEKSARTKRLDFSDDQTKTKNDWNFLSFFGFFQQTENQLFRVNSLFTLSATQPMKKRLSNIKFDNSKDYCRWFAYIYILHFGLCHTTKFYLDFNG